MCLALVHNYVAQVSNLLYRRFPIGGAKDISYAPNLSQTLQAGSPAIEQVGNLRYAKHVPDGERAGVRGLAELYRHGLGTRPRWRRGGKVAFA